MQRTALNQDQWRRVEEIYHAALDRNPGSRAAFLRDICRGDEALLREVQSLLDADEPAVLLDRGAGELAADLLKDDAPLAPGTQLGPYRVECEIGSGGMGRVYRARDTRLARSVAIKISRLEFSERFEREARAVAALNHPNICHIYDVGPNYLVLEFLEGTPVKGPLPLARVVEYAGQILDALDAAHRKGITHRDLKPANILVTKQRIKLLDFGLAKQAIPTSEVDATLTDRVTAAGTILGTLQYMSPEQLQSKPADARSDLFSFGCVLYEMLTGKAAFEGENPASVIAAILEREPKPLEVSPPLDRVVKRCLAKDPEQRFQCALDLKTALEWAVVQVPAPETAKRRWSVAAAAAVVLGLAGGWALWHSPQKIAEQRVQRFQIVPPKGVRFGATAASLSASPDGRYLTYNAIASGKQGIWLHPLDGTPGRLLTDQPGATVVFWSPNSKSIGWWAGTAVWTMGLSQASPKAVFDQGQGRGAAWTSDGRIVVGTPNKGLMMVPEGGGPAVPLTSVDTTAGEITHSHPQLLPHGRFLYWAQNRKPENSAVYAASFAHPLERVRILLSPYAGRYAPGGDGKDYLFIDREPALLVQQFDTDKLQLVGEPFTIAEQVMASGGPVIAAGISNGGTLLYSSGMNTSQFAWCDRRGKPLEKLGEPGIYTDFSISPEGKRVAAVQRAASATSDVWILDAQRQVLSRFTTTSGFHRFPVWSPDGRVLLFRQDGDLYRKDLSGSGDEKPVAKLDGFGRPCDWSSEAGLLYTRNSGETKSDLWTLRLTAEGTPATGARPRAYLTGPYNESSARFSPERNPQWVAYQSDETGRFEIYIASFPEPRRRIQITSGGGTAVEWGSDGRELFYVTPDFKLMSVSLRMGPEGLEPSAPRELFALQVGFGPITTNWYAVSRDGKRVLINQQPQDDERLELIVNWPGLLKKR